MTITSVSGYQRGDLTKAEQLFDLLTDPILHLLDLFVELENIFGLLETFAALT